MSFPSKSPDLNYRLGAPEDMDAVYDLYMNEQSNPYLTYDHMDKEEFEKIYNDLLPMDTLYVAEIEGQVIGSYRLIPKTHRQADTVYLGGFVVDPSFKGQGVGSKMLNHIKETAIDEGKKRIELTVDVENEPAIHLYKKIGFLIEGRIRMSYKRSSTGKHYDEYLMGLIL
jgi:putative acetyltransferase